MIKQQDDWSKMASFAEFTKGKNNSDNVRDSVQKFFLKHYFFLNYGKLLILTVKSFKDFELRKSGKKNSTIQIGNSEMSMKTQES